MKKFSLLYILCLIHLSSSGQDSINASSKKFQIYFQAGLDIKLFYGGRYVKPTKDNYNDPIDKHIYERSEKAPTVGINTGFLFELKFSRHWAMNSGILYYFRKDVYKRSQDTVLANNYSNVPRSQNINYALKIDYSNHFLEVPLFLNYRLKKFTISAGVYFVPISYRSAEYTYLISLKNSAEYPYSPILGTSGKTVKDYQLPLLFFPVVQAWYRVMIRKSEVDPFLGLFFGTKGEKDFYIQAGINVPLIDNHFRKSGTRR